VCGPISVGSLVEGPHVKSKRRTTDRKFCEYLLIPLEERTVRSPFMGITTLVRVLLLVAQSGSIYPSNRCRNNALTAHPRDLMRPKAD
jgi:hypothetical protein